MVSLLVAHLVAVTVALKAVWMVVCLAALMAASRVVRKAAY